MRRTTIIALILTVASVAGMGEESKLDTARIEQLTGLKGKFSEAEGVFKVSFPRTDLHFTVDGWAMPAFMGLTSWAAFKPGMQQNAMVMGDLVLLQDEVNPVMSAALDHGLQVTALHNHFFYDEPKVYFMHIAGEGHIATLAGGVRSAFDTVKKIRSANPQPARTFGSESLPAQSTLDSAVLQKLLGLKGEIKDGMFKAVFGRTVKIPCGCEAGKEMGINTWAAFAGADDNAIVDGDFVVLEDELQAALKSLRKSGINIVAIHHHMIGETPRMIFFHYWGRGPARELAEAVGAALKTTATETR
jgi:hypothetical protein